MPLEVGARGLINQRNMAVLAPLSSTCKVKSFKKFARTLGEDQPVRQLPHLASQAVKRVGPWQFCQGLI